MTEGNTLNPKPFTPGTPHLDGARRLLTPRRQLRCARRLAAAERCTHRARRLVPHRAQLHAEVARGERRGIARRHPSLRLWQRGVEPVAELARAAVAPWVLWRRPATTAAAGGPGARALIQDSARQGAAASGYLLGGISPGHADGLPRRRRCTAVPLIPRRSQRAPVAHQGLQRQ
eukprot:280302-Chlamydomonas_euryale.AAC.1